MKACLVLIIVGLCILPQWCAATSLALQAHLLHTPSTRVASHLAQRLIDLSPPRSIRQWLWSDNDASRAGAGTSTNLVGAVVRNERRQEQCLIFTTAQWFDETSDDLASLVAYPTNTTVDPCARSVHRYVNWAVFFPQTKTVLASVWKPEPAVVLYALTDGGSGGGGNVQTPAVVARVYRGLDLSQVDPNTKLCTSHTLVDDATKTKDYVAFMGSEVTFLHRAAPSASSTNHADARPTVWVWLSGDSADSMGAAVRLPLTRATENIQRLSCSASVVWAVRTTDASTYLATGSSASRHQNVPVAFVLSAYLRFYLNPQQQLRDTSGASWIRVMLPPSSSSPPFAASSASLALSESKQKQASLLSRLMYAPFTVQDICVTPQGLGVALLHNGAVVGFGCNQAYPAVFDSVQSATSTAPCSVTAVPTKTYLLYPPAALSPAPIDASRGIACSFDARTRLYRWAAFLDRAAIPSTVPAGTSVVEWSSLSSGTVEFRPLTIRLSRRDGEGEQATATAHGGNSSNGSFGGTGKRHGTTGFAVYQGDGSRAVPVFRTTGGRVFVATGSGLASARPGVSAQRATAAAPAETVFDNGIDNDDDDEHADELSALDLHQSDTSTTTPGDVSGYPVTATGIVLGVALTIVMVIISGLLILYCS